MQRLRQDIEGQAASVRDSQAAMSKDICSMKEAMQTAVAGMASSLGAYGRAVVGAGGSNGNGACHNEAAGGAAGSLFNGEATSSTQASGDFLISAAGFGRNAVSLPPLGGKHNAKQGNGYKR